MKEQPVFWQAIKASNIPEPDTSYFKPWRVGMIYEIEPGLKAIADKAFRAKHRRFYSRLAAYEAAKNEADSLVGWGARDPRLRSSGAWDCFFNRIIRGLNI